jgi:hypothetical protein
MAHTTSLSGPTTKQCAPKLLPLDPPIRSFVDQSRQIDLFAGMTGESGAWCSILSKSVGRMAEKRELSPIWDRRRWSPCPSACVCFAHVFKQSTRQYWNYEGAGSSPVCAAGRDVCVSGKVHRPYKRFQPSFRTELPAKLSFRMLLL